jgi:hypothetical protein
LEGHLAKIFLLHTLTAPEVDARTGLRFLLPIVGEELHLPSRKGVMALERVALGSAR